MADRAAQALKALRETPPRDFTRRRAELAKELADAGLRDAAAEVKRARKPSGSVWGVSALAREDPGALRAVLDAGEAVRREQRKALSGAGAGGLRDATREFQKSVGAAAAAVEQLLREAGESANAAVIARVRDTLLASAEADAAARKALEAGELDEDLSPVGFGNVFGLTLVKGAGRAPEKPREEEKRPPAQARPEEKRTAKERAEAKKREREEQARRERQEREERARREKEEREDRERRRRVLRKELERREKSVREAEAEEKRLERIASDAETRARAAREKAKAAAVEAERARRARDDAARAG